MGDGSETTGAWKLGATLITALSPPCSALSSYLDFQKLGPPPPPSSSLQRQSHLRAFLESFQKNTYTSVNREHMLLGVIKLEALYFLIFLLILCLRYMSTSVHANKVNFRRVNSVLHINLLQLT